MLLMLLFSALPEWNPDESLLRSDARKGVVAVRKHKSVGGFKLRYQQQPSLSIGPFTSIDPLPPHRNAIRLIFKTHSSRSCKPLRLLFSALPARNPDESLLRSDARKGVVAVRKHKSVGGFELRYEQQPSLSIGPFTSIDPHLPHRNLFLQSMA
jgi:hypothetical protein